MSISHCLLSGMYVMLNTLIKSLKGGLYMKIERRSENVQQDIYAQTGNAPGKWQEKALGNLYATYF